MAQHRLVTYNHPGTCRGSVFRDTTKCERDAARRLHSALQSYHSGTDSGRPYDTALILQFIGRENKYGAHNYAPSPVVLAKAQGVFVWDVDNRPYFDFCSACSATKQGHNHPKVGSVHAASDRQVSNTVTMP